MASEASEQEIPEEIYLNRGIVTVFEQTKETENRAPGDRYICLGYETQRYILDDDKKDFVSVAVPIAHIELPQPIEEDEFDDWLNSDVGQLAMARFFDDVKADILTDWGKELVEGDDAE